MNTHKVSKAIVCAACSVLFVLAFAGCASSSATSAEGSLGITVSASSETKVVPDKARVNIAVVSEAKDAEGCQSDNAKTVDKVLAALKDLGVQDTSIQTSYADLSPRYGSRTTVGDDDGDSYEDYAIIGYEMTTQLTISDLEIDSVGSVVQECVAAGANRTDGVEYYASNYDETYNAALGEALATAQAKAQNIAKATGVSLGKVTSVTEGYQDTSARYVASYADELETVADADAGAASKMMAGQIGISARVTVTYAIA